MMKTLTVSELNNQLKSLIESHYMQVIVEGEISRVTYHGSGHLYFTIKDKNSAISCVMFKSNKDKLKFKLEEGLSVILTGGITVYTPRGSYQINVIKIEPAGTGALALAYEQLKQKLEKKGYFDKDRKQKLPKFPKHVALVTSKTGAALQDMFNVAKKRWPLLKITIFDTIVQGKNSSQSIANSIKKADKIGADIIVVSRGGGSIEDLWGFNEEIVADSIYQAKTPIVSAVGHEIDFMISDFTADLRAPTPSAAMEIILPDINEIRLYLDTLYESISNHFKSIISKKERDLTHQVELFKQNSYKHKIENFKNDIKTVHKNFDSYIKLILTQKESLLQQLYQAYKLNNPANRDKVGYAQITKNQKIISIDTLHKDDIFEATSSKVKIKAKVISKSIIK